MKKNVVLHIEDCPHDLIKSLNQIVSSLADLKMTEIDVRVYENIKTTDVEENTLNIYVLNSIDAQHDFNALVTEERELYSMSEINSRINPVLQLLNKDGWDDNILNFTMIGGQRHFFSETDYNYLNDKYYDLIHLGDLKQEISEVEPYFRDSHVLRISFDALRYSDFKSKSDYNPCGFNAEDFVTFSRYAGLSPKLNYLVFHDIDLSRFSQDQSSQVLMAQMVWYMAEGYGFREKEDLEASTNKHYVFDIEKPDLQLDFIQSNRSGRWWYRFKDSEGVKHTFSCNFTDFESLQNKIVSPRIKSAILRYL